MSRQICTVVFATFICMGAYIWSRRGVSDHKTAFNKDAVASTVIGTSTVTSQGSLSPEEASNSLIAASPEGLLYLEANAATPGSNGKPSAKLKFLAAMAVKGLQARLRNTNSLVQSDLQPVETVKAKLARYKKAFKDFGGQLIPGHPTFKKGRLELRVLSSYFDYAKDLKPMWMEKFTKWAEHKDETSGYLTFAEFTRYMEAKDEEDRVVRRQAFELNDKDHNGFISKSELRQMLEKSGTHLTDDELNEMISEVDIDGDGRISFEEWTSLMS